MLGVVGTVITLIGFYLPAPTRRIAMPVSGLDEYTPLYQFNEIHSRHIDARPEAVYAAVQQVTAAEIPFFQTLTWIRRFGRKGPESILNAPDRKPILHVATSTTFLRLFERPPTETVIGTLVHAPPGTRRRDIGTPELFKELQRPGFAKAAMNFRIEANPNGGTTLWT